MNIETISEKIVKAQIKFPMLFIFGALLVTLLLIPGTLNLLNNVEPSLEKVLPSEIDEIKNMNNMRSQFGADMMYLLVHTQEPVFDIRTPEFIKYVNILSDDIKTIDFVKDVTSISDYAKTNNIIPESIQEIKSNVKQNSLSKQYHNDDYSFTIIKIKSDTGASAGTIKSVVDDIKYSIEKYEKINPGSKIEITGFNAIDKATFEVIISDFVIITILSMFIIGIIVFLTFKSFLKGILPLTVVGFSLLWTMSIAGYMNLTITVISMVSAAMIMGLGIDFGIHIVHQYYELRKKKSISKAMIETMKELVRAMIGASFTTMAGFLALLFGVLPAMQTLGIILAIGILNTMFGAILVLPVLTMLYDKYSNKDN